MLVLDCDKGTACLAFTYDGTRLIAGPHGGPLDIWTLATGERMKLPWHYVRVYGTPVVHPAGRFAISPSDPHLVVLSLDEPSFRPYTAAGGVGRVVVSPDGKWLVAATSKDRELLGFALAADGTPPESGPAWSAKPHGAFDLLGGFIGSGEWFLTLDNKLFVIRDAETGEVVYTEKYPSTYHRSITVAPNGSRVAVQGYDQIYVHDTATWGKPLRITDVKPFESLVFHPTRPILAGTQHGARVVSYLDAATGKFIARFDWDVGKMTSVAFSPDGTLAAAVSSSACKIVVWDVDE